jgi:hypothetical protein
LEEGNLCICLSIYLSISCCKTLGLRYNGKSKYEENLPLSICCVSVILTSLLFYLLCFRHIMKMDCIFTCVIHPPRIALLFKTSFSPSKFYLTFKNTLKYDIIPNIFSVLPNDRNFSLFSGTTLYFRFLCS